VTAFLFSIFQVETTAIIQKILAHDLCRDPDKIDHDDVEILVGRKSGYFRMAISLSEQR